MRKLTILTTLICVILQVNAQTLKTDNDSAAYALGVNTAKNLIQELETVGLSKDFFMKGFTEYNKSVIPNDKIEPIINNYFQKLQNEQNAKMQDLCLENAEFLRKNKENKDVVTLENGLQYKVVVKGNGATPSDNDKVKVHYKGSLIDGTVFDSSIERGQPAVFPVNGLIPGFTQVLKLMPVGSTYIAYIPSELGYGMNDMGTIKPCSTLIFEIQLLSIVSDSNNEQPAETEDSTATDSKKAKKQKKSK
ncbi:MAG: FKBP-type peptidyl-prolyl cis-trans isomerase [Bacteroidales bacterium]|nr:FKBP-type peptidyl-prolyl cis-trans isomerase [Bacteroidales bacterium]